MTKEEFISRYDAISNPLFEKYGALLYYLASDIFNIGAMEKLCEAQGYTTKRQQYGDGMSLYSEIYSNGEHIGHLDNQGFPSIQFDKRKRKYAKVIAKHKDIIEPIEGVHRILGWHTVRGKYHCLAGGETVLNFLPVNITDEMMNDFLVKTKLIHNVSELKRQEIDAYEKFDNENK